MMKLALKINWILVTLLSIATGLFKLTMQEADITLFESIGFSPTATAILGGVQLVGGMLMIPEKSRRAGAFIITPTFIIASIAVFASNMMVFGIVSLLFIAMAALVVYMEKLNS